MQEIDYIKAHLQKPVVLIGMMGSGKSRLGRVLAEKLSLPFFDSDHVIEAKAGRTVQEIFTKDGEPKFREAEKRTILELLKNEACVIATGGGAVTNPEVLTALKENAVLIWLQAEIPELMARLKNVESRPLLKGDNPEAVLTNLMEKRAGLYAQAHITVAAGDPVIKDVKMRLIKKLYDFLKACNV